MMVFIKQTGIFRQGKCCNIIEKAVDLLLILLVIPPILQAEEPAPFEELPLPVQVVLTKINPMLQKKDYPHAIKTLIVFQQRGGDEPAPDQPDPKGYHHAEIYYTLGNCYLLQERYQPAVAAFKKAVARDDFHTYAWLNLAKASYELDQYAEAGCAFGQGYATATEKNPEYLYFSAAAYLMAEKHLRSIQIFEQLLADHPKAVKPEWKEHLVHALLGAGQPQRALPYIQELTRIYTGDKQIQWQEILLHQYMQLQMHTKALQFAHLLTRQAPTVAKWWKGLTHIQLNNNQYEEALAALTIYSFLTPLSAEEKKLLADLNLQMGIPVKAIPQYEMVLADKADKETLQHLVIAYRQLGQPETAIRKLDQSKLTRNDDDLMLLKGELLYAMKYYAQAATIYRKAARKKGTHAGRAWLMAGYAAWQTNDFSASKEAFVKATEYRKEKRAATMALKQLASLAMTKPVSNQTQEVTPDDQTLPPKI